MRDLYKPVEEGAVSTKLPDSSWDLTGRFYNSYKDVIEEALPHNIHSF